MQAIQTKSLEFEPELQQPRCTQHAMRLQAQAPKGRASAHPTTIAAASSGWPAPRAGAPMQANPGQGHNDCGSSTQRAQQRQRARGRRRPPDQRTGNSNNNAHTAEGGRPRDSEARAGQAGEAGSGGARRGVWPHLSRVGAKRGWEPNMIRKHRHSSSAMETHDKHLAFTSAACHTL